MTAKSLMQDADARRDLVEKAIGDGRTICQKCGATLATYADVCIAALDSRCEGFQAIEAAGSPESQHRQIGSFTHSVNEHGCLIEHSDWQPSSLGEDGRCCGRKTHPYKSHMGLKGRPDPHSCCLRCGREYGPNGNQRPNYAYKLRTDGTYHRDDPKGLPK